MSSNADTGMKGSGDSPMDGDNNDGSKPPPDHNADKNKKKPFDGKKNRVESESSPPSSPEAPTTRSLIRIPPSPGTVSTCNSSTGDDIDDDKDEPAPAGGAVMMAPPSAAPQSPGSYSDQRRALDFQLMQLGLATSSCVAVLIVTLIPMPILALCGVSGGFLAAFCYKLYERLLLEYQTHIVHGDGIGRYLPDSIRRQLVDMTLHDCMTDDSLTKEYGFLMLYFIPGIPIDEYISRLVPRHQYLLRRRGLGHLFGPSFMRWIVGGRNAGLAITGETQDRLEVIDESVEGSSVAALPPPQEVDDYSEDDDVAERDWVGGGIISATGGDVDAPDEAYARFMGLAIPGDDSHEVEDRKPAAKKTVSDETNDEEDLANELYVLYDACVDCVAGYSNSAYEMARGAMAVASGSSLHSVTRNIWRATSAIAVVSVSIGMAGWYNGVYQQFPPSAITPRSLPTLPTIRLSFPSSSALWSTTLASGLTSVGLTFLMMVWPSSSSTSDGESDSSASICAKKEDSQ